jgi:hypothetical protein
MFPALSQSPNILLAISPLQRWDEMAGLYDRSLRRFNQFNALEVQAKETGLEEEYHSHRGAPQDETACRAGENNHPTDHRHRLRRWGAKLRDVSLGPQGWGTPHGSPSYFETARAALSITSATSLGCET